MSAQILQFPRLHRDEEERLFAEWMARIDADPEKQKLLAKARAAIAQLPRREG